MRLPFSVQVFLVTRQANDWSVLLLQRNPRPEFALPDFWQGVSGALEGSESFEAAALREVHEETAIHIASANATGYEQVFSIKPEWRSAYGSDPTHVLERVFYTVIPDRVEPVLSAEHKAFRWCSESEAVALLTFANNRPAVQSVFELLRDAGTRAGNDHCPECTSPEDLGSGNA